VFIIDLPYKRKRMKKTIYVIEDIHNLPGKKLFNLFGVEWEGTPYWWICPIWILAVGTTIAYYTQNNKGGADFAGNGLMYAGIIALSITLHSIGHLTFGKFVGHPMTGNLVTATLPVNLYDGKRYPSRVHVIRSLGGPCINLISGLALLAIDRLIGHNQFIQFAAYVNLMFFIVSLAPIPTMDGGVLVRELRNWRKE